MSSENVVLVLVKNRTTRERPPADNGRHTRALFFYARHTFTFYLRLPFFFSSSSRREGTRRWKKREQPSNLLAALEGKWPRCFRLREEIFAR